MLDWLQHSALEIHNDNDQRGRDENEQEQDQELSDHNLLKCAELNEHSHVNGRIGERLAYGRPWT